MLDNVDRDNIRSLVIRIADGSIHEWLDTLELEELEYAQHLLVIMQESREHFVNTSLN